MKTEMPVRMNTMNPVTLCSLKQNHWVSTKPSAAFTPFYPFSECSNLTESTKTPFCGHLFKADG